MVAPTPLPYEIRGARIGREPATINLKWERQEDSTITAASVNVALDPTTFLVPVNVVVVVPSADFPVERETMLKYTNEAVYRTLFDDRHTTEHFRAPSAVYEGYWNWLTHSLDTRPDDEFGFRIAESLVTSQDDADRTRFTELGYQPDTVFAQCGIQFRMADFAVVEDANARHVRFTDNGLPSGNPLCVDGASISISAILRSFASQAAPSLSDPTLPTVVVAFRVQGDLCPKVVGGTTLTDELAAIAVSGGPEPTLLSHELGHLVGMNHIKDPGHCTFEGGVLVGQSLMCEQPISPRIAGCEFRDGVPITPPMNCSPRNDLLANGTCDEARQHLGQKADPSPPLLELGPDQVLECTSPAGATATVTAAASDPQSGVSRVTWTVDGVANPNTTTTLALDVPLGAPVVVAAQAVNGVGRQAFDQVSITVLDRQPPVLPALPQLAADACDPALPVTVPVPVALDACTAGAVAVTGNVVQTDGAPLPTPVPITNGQVSLAPGVHDGAGCVGQHRHGDPNPERSRMRRRGEESSRRRSRALPLRVGCPRPARQLRHRAGRCRVEAQTGSIVSRGSVTLRDRSSVQGSVRIQGALTRLNQTTITGDIRTETPVSLPPPPVIDGPWPTVSQPGFSVEPNTVRSIAAGAFGTVSVKSGATLILAAGTYYFEALHLEPQARVKVDPSTLIELLSGFTHRGNFVGSTTDGAPVASATVRYRGAAAVSLESAFIGSILAPNAALTLGGMSGTQYEGRFFARDLELRPDVTIVAKGMLVHTPWNTLESSDLDDAASEPVPARSNDVINDEEEEVAVSADGPEYTCSVSPAPGARKPASLLLLALVLPLLSRHARRRARNVHSRGRIETP
jgi:hypothetical protein